MLGVLLFLVRPIVLFGMESENSLPARSCRSVLVRLGVSALKSATVVGGVALGLTAGSEIVGNLHETPHIGLSIYLDYENVLTYLSPHEKAQFEKEKKNPLVIADILVEHLFRKSNDTVEFAPYLKPLMASSYFDESSSPPDVCRHKALVMKAILNRLGIEAQLKTGTISSDSGRGEHVWLFIPIINKVADPMNRMLVDPEEYAERFEPNNHWNVIQWAKPLGILGR